jgi:hypothetical protein
MSHGQTWPAVLHAVDTLRRVHAVILPLQALMLPFKLFVVSDGLLIESAPFRSATGA